MPGGETIVPNKVMNAAAGSASRDDKMSTYERYVSNASKCASQGDSAAMHFMRRNCLRPCCLRKSPARAAELAAANPGLKTEDIICRRHLPEQRTRHVRQLLELERGELSLRPA